VLFECQGGARLFLYSTWRDLLHWHKATPVTSIACTTDCIFLAFLWLLLLQLITSSDISVFELLSSGAVRCLTQYLHGTDLSASNQHEQQLLQRLRAFAAAGQLPADQGGDAAAADAATVGASNTPLTALVCKLQTSLASAEAFPVLVNRMLPTTASMGRSYGRSGSLPGSFSGAGSLSSGLAALSQPFKLRLVRHDEVGGAWCEACSAL
jgi:E3 ubiquitin-protein ligase TRIP12